MLINSFYQKIKEEEQKALSLRYSGIRITTFNLILTIIYSRMKLS
jgi:hypothetical protein